MINVVYWARLGRVQGKVQRYNTYRHDAIITGKTGRVRNQFEGGRSADCYLGLQVGRSPDGSKHIISRLECNLTVSLGQFHSVLYCIVRYIYF